MRRTLASGRRPVVRRPLPQAGGPLAFRPPVRSRSPLALSLLGCVLVAGPGCDAPRPTITVGSKNFSEQDLLGEIVAQWIERTTDLDVRRRLHLGGTFICHRALVAGEIDVYVEYTGTALTAILERAPVSDPDSVFRTVRADYLDRFDLEWFAPLGFENTFAMLVRRSVADSLGVRTLSEAAPRSEGWVAGFGSEFMERPDGFPGLREAYDLRFRSPPRVMDLGLLYRALASGEIDLTAGNSTDGRIEALDLLMLRDDRRYFPPYEGAAVARRAILERHPALRRALEGLSGKIDTGEMRRLNRAVDVEGRDYRQVAGKWVERALAMDGQGDRGPH